jgi:rRNA maturation endonuclease Nob1
MATATGESLKPLKNRLPAGHTERTPGRSCVNCKAVEHDDKAKFCRDCGTPFESPSTASRATATCSNCGETFPKGSRFCPTCGNPIDEAAAAERAAGTINENAESVRLERCKGCGAVCDGETNFCDNCGAVLTSDGGGGEPADEVTFVCNTCGITYDAPDARFCEECGESLSAVAVPPRAVSSTTAGAPAPARAIANPTAPKWSDEPPQTKTLPKMRGAPATAAPPARTSNGIGQDADDDDEGFDAPQEMPINLVPCQRCGRRFNTESIARHENVCQRQSTRKVFDSRKARTEGTEAASYVRKLNRDGGSKTEAPKKDWRAESLAFRRSMKEARVVDQVLKAGGTAKDLPPPSYSENAHYSQCPHCGRRFAPDVAERHIPKCSTTINKPKAPPRRR